MRPRHRKKTEKGNTLKLAVLFCVLLVVLLLFSLLVRAWDIVQASRYDGTHRFSILVLDSKTKEGGEIVSFSSINKTISVLPFVSKSKVDPNTGEFFLGTPIDGFVTADLQPGNSPENMENLFSYLVFNKKNFSTNLTIYDLIRLWFFVRTTPYYSVKIQNATAVFGDEQSLDTVVNDKIITQLFADETISREKSTIQIINGTDVSGLAGQLARLINNMGGNVVEISTSDNTLDKSSIAYSGEKTYTVSKLEEILQLNAIELPDTGISDIVVSLGKDKLSELGY